MRSPGFFWKNCGEADVTTGQWDGRMDPVLKLFKNSQVMLTENESVEYGKANGTCATIEKVVLKAGEQPKLTSLDSGACVQSVLAGQVDYLVLRHCNKDIQPQVFQLKPKEFAFKAEVPVESEYSVGRIRSSEEISMLALQFPLVPNCATTGFKLQGKNC